MGSLEVEVRIATSTQGRFSNMTLLQGDMLLLDTGFNKVGKGRSCSRILAHINRDRSRGVSNCKTFCQRYIANRFRNLAVNGQGEK